MNIANLGKFSSAFGLIRAPCKSSADEFLTWQQDILQPWGMFLQMEKFEGQISEALNGLAPLTAPIATKYLFWPLSPEWTLYFDNGVGGTDAGPPTVLSRRMQTDAARAVMADESRDPASGRLTQYGASILEFYCNGEERRHVFAANDGGKWKFGQAGVPFPFENREAYQARSVKDRFTPTMLLNYLKELGANLSDCAASADSCYGYVLSKHGKLPPSLTEFRE